MPEYSTVELQHIQETIDRLSSGGIEIIKYSSWGRPARKTLHIDAGDGCLFYEPSQKQNADRFKYFTDITKLCTGCTTQSLRKCDRPQRALSIMKGHQSLDMVFRSERERDRVLQALDFLAVKKGADGYRGIRCSLSSSSEDLLTDASSSRSSSISSASSKGSN